MTEIPHWPCPHRCMNWARACNPHAPQTNHHPSCEFVDKSLIDVFSVRVPGEEGGCVVESKALAERMANEDPAPPLEIVPQKMHRELFEQLPEFAGF